MITLKKLSFALVLSLISQTLMFSADIIPKPVKYVSNGERFVLTPETKIL